MPPLMRFAACLLVISLACGLAAPALCAGSAPKPMPCCDPDRDCGTGVGRPSCCVDMPGDGGQAPTVPSGTPSRTLAVTVSATPATLADLPVPFHFTPTDGPAATGETPPLFLLHATFLC